jgi:hypothetical protein
MPVPKRYQRKTTPEKTVTQYERELGPEFRKDANRVLDAYLDSFYRWGPPATRAVLGWCVRYHAPRRSRSDLSQRCDLLRPILTPPGRGRSIHSVAKEIEQKSGGETSFETARGRIKDALQAARDDYERDRHALPLSEKPTAKKRHSKKYNVWFYW